MLGPCVPSAHVGGVRVSFHSGSLCPRVNGSPSHWRGLGPYLIVGLLAQACRCACSSMANAVKDHSQWLCNPVHSQPVRLPNLLGPQPPAHPPWPCAARWQTCP